MKSKSLWWPFISQHRARAATIVLLGVCTSYCTLLLPLSLGKFMEIMTGAGGGKTRALHLLGISLPEDLTSFFLFFFIILILKFTFSWLHTWLTSMFGELFAAGLRKKFLDFRLQNASADLRPDKASLLMPFANDMKTVRTMLTKGVIGFTTDLLFLVMALYVLIRLAPALTAAVIIMTGLFFFIHRWYNHISKPLFAEKRNRQAGLLNRTAALLSNGQTDFKMQQRKLDEKNQKFIKTLWIFHARKALLKSLSPFMLYFLLAVIMIMISAQNNTERLDAGTILTYILLLMTLFPTLRNLIRIENTWVQGALAAEKFLEPRAKSPKTGAEKPEILKKTTNNSFSLLHWRLTKQQ